MSCLAEILYLHPHFILDRYEARMKDNFDRKNREDDAYLSRYIA